MADNRNMECASVNSPGDLLSNGKIFLVKYPSRMSVTMDPESSNDGTFWPNKSIGIAGHCETALCITFCFILEDTALLDNVWIISLKWLVGIGDVNGSTVAPFPWPLELGAFSLTYSQTDYDVTEKPFIFADPDNCQCHDPYPCSNCKSFLGVVPSLPAPMAGSHSFPKNLPPDLYGLNWLACSAFVDAVWRVDGLSNSRIWTFSAIAPSSLVSEVLDLRGLSTDLLFLLVLGFGDWLLLFRLGSDRWHWDRLTCNCFTGMLVSSKDSSQFIPKLCKWHMRHLQQ